MQRRFLNIRQVHRNLRDSIFLHIPANGFHMFQHSGNADRFAVFIEDRLSGRRAVFGFDPPVFSHIKGDRVGPSHRLRVQVHIVGDQEIPRADDGCARLFIENGRSEIRLPGRLV